MTNEEKLRETFPKTIFIFQKNGNDETTAIMCSSEWLQADYNQMYKDSEPCEDCVSRDTILREMGKRHKEGDAITIGYIKNLPPVTPKQRSGKWIQRHIIGGRNIEMIVCSECGEEFSYDAETGVSEYNFCPNCGAKMEGESE